MSLRVPNRLTSRPLCGAASWETPVVHLFLCRPQLLVTRQASRPRGTTAPGSRAISDSPGGTPEASLPLGTRWLEAGGRMRWLFVVPAPGFRDSRPQRWPPAQIRRSVSSGDVAERCPTQSLSAPFPEGRAGNHFCISLQIKTQGRQGGCSGATLMHTKALLCLRLPLTGSQVEGSVVWAYGRTG